MRLRLKAVACCREVACLARLGKAGPAFLPRHNREELVSGRGALLGPLAVACILGPCLSYLYLHTLLYTILT